MIWFTFNNISVFSGEERLIVEQSGITYSTTLDGIDNYVNRSRENFIQFPASAINPVVGAAASSIINYGIGTAQEFVDNLSRYSAVDYRLPQDIDYTKQVKIRTGWSASVGTGTARLTIEHLWVLPNDDLTAAGTVTTILEPVSATPNGLNTIDHVIGLPPAGATALRIRYGREAGDATDTVSGSVYLIGSSMVYNL